MQIVSIDPYEEHEFFIGRCICGIHKRTINDLLECRKSHGLCPSIECSVCGQSFSSFRERNQHFSDSHPNESMRVKCSKCPQAFLRYEEYQRHFNIEHPERSIIMIQCTICPNLIFENFEELAKHFSNMHGAVLIVPPDQIDSCHLELLQDKLREGKLVSLSNAK